MSYYSYYVGLDLGQAQDPTALTVIERPIWIPDVGQWVSPADLTSLQAQHVAHKQGTPPTPPIYDVRHLHRYPLRTAYPEIVKDVAGLLQSPAILDKGYVLLVDATGVGRPVVDMFVAAGLRPTAITITGGDSVSRHGSEYRVPKRDLVGALQALFQSDRLRIADSLPLAPTLVHELENFRVSINLKTGHDSYEAWREGIHDDLVLATAMAAWYAQQPAFQWGAV